MAVKIKLKRMGKIRSPHYRIIVADARSKRDGRAIEEIGKYHPKESPSFIEVDSERAQYWLGVGAQPTEPVLVLLKVTGDWQKHKGLPGAEGTLQTREAKADKSEKFNKLLADVHKDDDKTGARKKTVRKPAAKTAKAADKADDAKADEAKADVKADDKPAKKAAAKKAPVKKTAKAADEAKADVKADDKPAKKIAAKKAPVKKTAKAADEAKADVKADDKPAKTAAKKATADGADTASDKADAADAQAEES